MDKVVVTVLGFGQPQTLQHRVVAAGVVTLCGPHSASKKIKSGQGTPLAGGWAGPNKFLLG